MNIPKKITQIIADISEGKVGINDESIFTNHLLDSMDLITLIGFVEDEYNINIVPEDVSYENFDSIMNICSFIEMKLKA